MRLRLSYSAVAEAKLDTSLGSCIARVTNTTGSPLSQLTSLLLFTWQITLLDNFNLVSSAIFKLVTMGYCFQ